MGALTLWVIIAALADAPPISHLGGWWLFFLILAIVLDIPAHARNA